MAKAGYSSIVSRVRGKVDKTVFILARNGPVVRNAPTYSFPVSPAQRITVNYFAAAMALYKTLTRPQVLVWNAYAKTITRRDPLTGREFHPTGLNVFVGLTCKFLQINPDSTPPLAPPPGIFLPDKIMLTTEGQPGVIVFTASGPNVGTTQTELLLQKLPSVCHSPTDKYISAGFVTFFTGGLSTGLSVESGLYVPAYRFVNSQTGQMSTLQILSEVEV